MLKIIECGDLPQLKYSTKLREAAAYQLGIRWGTKDLLGIFDEGKVLVLLPVAVAGAETVDPMSLEIKNPVFSPGLSMSWLAVGEVFQLHGTVGVMEEDF